MERKLKFIHTADIHLGSFLHISSKVTEQIQNIIDNAVEEAMKRIVQAAIDNAIDFIVISGDTFEGSGRSLKADSFFYDMMNKLGNIQVYIICGNHDPMREWKEIFKFPNNVHILGSENVETFEFMNDGKVKARIRGVSYRTKKETRKLVSDFKILKDGIPTLGLFHTQLDTAGTSYMPALRSEVIGEEGIDYWALGHIHKFRCINNINPMVIYPGIPQGRDFGEEGIGGCVLAVMDERKQFALSYIPVSPVVFEKININIDEEAEKPEDLTSIEDLIVEKAEELVLKNMNIPENINVAGQIENVVQGFVVQWTITGRGIIADTVSGKEEEAAGILLSNLNKRLASLKKRPFIFTDSVMLRVAPEIPELQILEDKNPVFGELKDVVQKFITDEELELELKKVMGDVWNKDSDTEEEIYDRFYLDDETYNSILKQAEEMIIEKLYKAGEHLED